MEQAAYCPIELSGAFTASVDLADLASIGTSEIDRRSLYKALERFAKGGKRVAANLIDRAATLVAGNGEAGLVVEQSTWPLVKSGVLRGLLV
jgi:hypothetical protein